MAGAAMKETPMLHDELADIREPVLRKVQDHPFWSGLRDGSLLGEALARFVGQDTGVLLPAYARALARCAATGPDDADALLLGHCVVGTLTARDALRQGYTLLAGRLGLPKLGRRPPADPAVHAHATFFAAASARSFYAGIGALLPMVWFNAEVAANLKQNVLPGSRYVPWVEIYHPGESYQQVVRAFLDMTDRAGESCSDRQRQLIIEQFSIGIRYEWEFAECCLRTPAWPV
jgi:thiaminase (transcriptional activator TenA)